MHTAHSFKNAVVSSYTRRETRASHALTCEGKTQVCWRLKNGWNSHLWTCLFVTKIDYIVKDRDIDTTFKSIILYNIHILLTNIYVEEIYSSSSNYSLLNQKLKYIELILTSCSNLDTVNSWYNQRCIH